MRNKEYTRFFCVFLSFMILTGLSIFYKETVLAVPAVSVSYQTHVQDIGWQDYVSDGEASGTSGQSKRLEAIRIKLSPEGSSGGIEYRTHVQDVGWTDWVGNDAPSGTIGQSRRLESIQIRMTGAIADEYDVFYRVHVQNLGWMDWAKNGDFSGTAGYSFRLEAIEIKLVRKGDPAPGVQNRPFFDHYALAATVSYRTHVQMIGWQEYVRNGDLSGTTGQSRRLEAIQIELGNSSGSVEYRTHVQDVGWTEWVANNAQSGTVGESKRLEAIQIRLTGEVSGEYDIYYCVYVQNRGWMDWVKNGQTSGTDGLSLRMEAIRVLLVPAGFPAPEKVQNPVPPPSTDHPVYIGAFLDPRSVTPNQVLDPLSLTVLVNKYNSVSPDYVPVLVAAKSSGGCYLRPEAAEAWDLMRAACYTATAKTLYITSGYRSYASQAYIFQDAIATKGLERAVSKYAYPGRSEHQLGLALDIATTASPKISGSFLSTPAGIWMIAHAHEYGFILRYPAGKESITGYAFEAWHFRYVGVDLATAMHNGGQTLEEYFG